MTCTCIIVDDEPTARNILRKYIADVSFLELIGEFKNALEGLEFVQNNKVELIFLDIEMPKLTGINFANIITQKTNIIFTTAHREFALDGFELNAIDYLLKPFSFERFMRAVNKVNLKMQSGSIKTTPDNKYEYFKVNGKNVKVDYSEIEYIEGLSNYVKIHTRNGALVAYYRLIDLEQKLPKSQFVRIHKSFIISLTNMKAYGTDYVEILDKQLSIGNTYKDSFFKTIKHLF